MKNFHPEQHVDDTLFFRTGNLIVWVHFRLSHLLRITYRDICCMTRFGNVLLFLRFYTVWKINRSFAAKWWDYDHETSTNMARPLAFIITPFILQNFTSQTWSLGGWSTHAANNRMLLKYAHFPKVLGKVRINHLPNPTGSSTNSGGNLIGNDQHSSQRELFCWQLRGNSDFLHLSK